MNHNTIERLFLSGFFVIICLISFSMGCNYKTSETKSIKTKVIYVSSKPRFEQSLYNEKERLLDRSRYIDDKGQLQIVFNHIDNINELLKQNTCYP